LTFVNEQKGIRGNNKVGLNVMRFGDNALTRTGSWLNKNHIGTVRERIKKTVVHPLPKADPSKMVIISHRWNNGEIYFKVFKIRIARLFNIKLCFSYWQPVWYHLETNTLHKRNVKIKAISGVFHPRFKVKFKGQWKVGENGFRS